MAVSDPKAGSVFISVVATVLLLAIISGGALLVAYLILPVSQPWLPVAGVSLVCLPWFFWLLTFLYHVFSPCCCGPRSAVADGGTSAGNSGSGDGGNEDGADAVECEAPEGESSAGSPGGGGRCVHFGGAVVLSDPEAKDNSSSGISDKESSFASHESEVHLT